MLAGAKTLFEEASGRIRCFAPMLLVRTTGCNLFIDENGVETSSMTLDKRISLKYWLDDPFWTRMSSLNLSLELLECKLFAGCVERVVLAVSDVGTVGIDVSTFLALSTDFSRVEIREAMSAMMVSFARRFRGPNGG